MSSERLAHESSYQLHSLEPSVSEWKQNFIHYTPQMEFPLNNKKQCFSDVYNIDKAQKQLRRVEAAEEKRTNTVSFYLHESLEKINLINNAYSYDQDRAHKKLLSQYPDSSESYIFVYILLNLFKRYSLDVHILLYVNYISIWLIKQFTHMCMHIHTHFCHISRLVLSPLHILRTI